MRYGLLIFTIFLSLYSTAKTYQINTQHSFVNFEVDYMKLSVVRGSFDQFRGYFEYNEKSKAVEKLKFFIKTESINTRDKKRDKHLRGKDFFNAKEYEYINFISEEFLYEDGIPSKVIGNLELNGIKKEITFTIKWKGIKEDPFDEGKISLFAEVESIVNRKDFDITWNKNLDSGGVLVSDEVRINAVIEANPTDQKPAFSRFFRKKTKKKSKINSSEKTVEQKSDINSSVESKEVDHSNGQAPKAYKQKEFSFLKLTLGFGVFLILCLIAGLLKHYTYKVCLRSMSETKSSFLSDTILYSFLLLAAILTAPLMGYGDFFFK